MPKRAIRPWRRRVRIGCGLCLALWLLPVLLFPVRRELWNWKADFMAEWKTDALTAPKPNLASVVGLLVIPETAEPSVWIPDRQTVRQFQGLVFQGSPWLDRGGDFALWGAPSVSIYAVDTQGDEVQVVEYASMPAVYAWRPRSVVELLLGLPYLWEGLWGPPAEMIQVRGESRFFPATRQFTGWMSKARAAGSAVTVQSVSAPALLGAAQVRRAAQATGMVPAAVVRLQDGEERERTFLIALIRPASDAEIEKLRGTIDLAARKTRDVSNE